MHTDLTVTGKVAQFGRGIMADVSTKLLDQFVENLETTVLAGNAGEALRSPTRRWRWQRLSPSPPPRPSAPDAGPEIRRLDHPEAEPVDLVDAAGASVAKRVVPVAIGGLLLLLFVRGLRRRHRS